MRGKPKILNTKADYANIKTLFPDSWSSYWQQLLDSRFCWQRKKELVAGEDGVTDDTHCIQTETEENGTEHRYQADLVEDQFAEIFRLGFTVAEVEEQLQ